MYVRKYCGLPVFVAFSTGPTVMLLCTSYLNLRLGPVLPWSSEFWDLDCMGGRLELFLPTKPQQLPGSVQSSLAKSYKSLKCCSTSNSVASGGNPRTMTV